EALLRQLASLELGDGRGIRPGLLPQHLRSLSDRMGFDPQRDAYRGLDYSQCSSMLGWVEVNGPVLVVSSMPRCALAFRSAYTASAITPRLCLRERQQQHQPAADDATDRRDPAARDRRGLVPETAHVPGSRSGCVASAGACARHTRAHG